MSDIRLYHIDNGSASELKGTASHLEKPLQSLIEENLNTLLGVRFVKTEHSTGKTHGGRIDTLGLDENNCPVILEYKRSTDENVISQGLYYLDWLMDHQAEYKLLVIDRFGSEVADSIDWSAPRLVCIASDFTKFDGHAVQQINRNIELIRYRKFGDDLLLFELANSVSVPSTVVPTVLGKTRARVGKDKPVGEWLAEMTAERRELFDSIDNYLMALGEDVQRKELRVYFAYKRIKNFVTIVLTGDKILLYAKLNPDTISIDETYMRDVRKIGHWGTGDLEITIKTHIEFEKIKPLLQWAYEGE